MFPYTTGCEAYPLRQMDMGSLTGAHMLVRAVDTEGGQAQTRLHKSGLGGTETLSLDHAAPPWDRTQGLRI